MSVRGYLIYVPFGNIATMEYGSNGAPDKVTVATVPGHLAGPFEVRQVIKDHYALASLMASGELGLPPDTALAAAFEVASVPRQASEGACPVTGTWEGTSVRCVHPPGHKAFLDHFDRDRGLRWAWSGDGEVTAWPATENETWALGSRRYRREMLEYTDRNRGLMSPAARQELEELRAEEPVPASAGIRPARLSADLTMADGRTVHVPVVPPAGPASAGRIRVAIPYPASAMPGLVISAAVMNEELGVVFRSGFPYTHAEAGDVLTIEFGEESLDAEALARAFGERP